MDDISSRKREIEAKLEEEKRNIAWLTESLAKSDLIANNMLNILTSFEDRLCKLEDNILPVHKETTDLQTRQENVERTITLLETVLSYHNVSGSVKPVIEEGPSGHLDSYLKNMERVQEAISFFEQNNPDSLELSHLKSLNDTGRESLEKEFRNILKRQSKPVPVVVLRDILDAMVDASDSQSRNSSDESQIQHFSEKVTEELQTIVRWLADHQKTTDFMSVYSQIRSSMLQASLQALKDEDYRFNVSVLVGGKVGSTAAPPSKAKVQEKRKLMHRRSTKGVDAYGHKRQPSAAADQNVKDEEENIEVATFITCTGALLKLLQSEKNLVQAIIPEERQIPIFSQLANDVLVTYSSDAEAVANAARKLHARLDHSAARLILPTLKYLRIVKPEFDSLLKMVNVDTRKKFLNVISLFESTGWRTLEEIVEKLLESDKHVTMPKDGTVHEVISNVTVFLEDLVKYLETTAAILASVEQTKSSLDEVQAGHKVAEYISRVLGALSSNLLNKAKFYDSAALQAVFMLNNYNYIIKSLQKSGLMTLLAGFGHSNLQGDYDLAIDEEMTNYLNTWQKVINHLQDTSSEKLADAFSKGHLKEKHRQAIKDKFKGFNTDFEEMQQAHKLFSVPDVEMKKRICDRVCGEVIPAYTEFLKKYREVQFTRNVEKYIKYDVEECKWCIASIFNIAATS